MSARAKGGDAVVAGEPLVSVIVPTHARPERLACLLASLARQTIGAEQQEVVVVDDGSPPSRRPERASLPANALLLRQPRRGPAAARNAGAARARGALLAFIDDDCIAEPGWLEALLAACADRPRALLGGRTVNGLPENLFSEVAESVLGFLERDERRAGRTLSFVASNNLACAREAFVESGGFDAGFPLAAGEDRAFCRAWRERVGEIARVPNALVYHHHAHDLASFWRQQRDYGRGAARFHAIVAAAPSRSRLRPPRELAFYARLLLHPLGRRDLPLARRLAALPLLALSQLAVTAGLQAERRTAARSPGGGAGHG